MNDSVEVMAGQVAEWSRKYDLLESQHNELTATNTTLQGTVSEKELCIKELVTKLNGLNQIEVSTSSDVIIVLFFHSYIIILFIIE